MSDVTNPAPLTREDLYKAFPNQPKVVRAFEALFRLNAATTDTIGADTGTTSALTDATVITLSANDVLTNERILFVDAQGFTLNDQGPGKKIILGLVNLIQKSQGCALFFNLEEDTALDLPASGRVVALPDDATTFADDAAAAAGGILVGSIYRKAGGAVNWRQV